MTVKTVTEIAERIFFLYVFKEEMIRQKKRQDAKKLTAKLKELYWVLGVKID